MYQNNREQHPKFTTLLCLRFHICALTHQRFYPSKTTKAPVLRLDTQGQEIDEHGNVVNVTKPSNLNTLKVNINKQKKDAFEILKLVLEVDLESNTHFDERMDIEKTKAPAAQEDEFSIYGGRKMVKRC